MKNDNRKDAPPERMGPFKPPRPDVVPVIRSMILKYPELHQDEEWNRQFFPDGVPKK